MRYIDPRLPLLLLSLVLVSSCATVPSSTVSLNVAEAVWKGPINVPLPKIDGISLPNHFTFYYAPINGTSVQVPASDAKIKPLPAYDKPWHDKMRRQCREKGQWYICDGGIARLCGKGAHGGEVVQWAIALQKGGVTWQEIGVLEVTESKEHLLEANGCKSATPGDIIVPNPNMFMFSESIPG